MQATYFFRTIALVFHFSQIYLTTFSIIRKLMLRTEFWTGQLVVWVIFMKIVLKAFPYVVFWLAGENIGHILFRISNLAHIGPLLLTHTHLITKSDLPCIALGTHTCPKGLTHTLTHTHTEREPEWHAFDECVSGSLSWEFQDMLASNSNFHRLKFFADCIFGSCFKLASAFCLFLMQACVFICQKNVFNSSFSSCL